MSSLPPTTEEVNAIARDVCLSVCLSVGKITQKHVHGFGWHFACWQLSGHGRTDQLLSQIGSYSGCRNQIAFSDIVCIATRNFITSGKSHIQVLGMVIWCLSQQRCVVLRRQNTVVGGKCAIPSALLVLFVNGSWTHNDEMCNLYIMYYAENGWKPYFTCISNSFPDLFKDIPADNDVPLSPNAWLNAVATGHVHKGTVSTVILPACCVLLCTDPRYLHLATSELWCWSGGRGILTEHNKNFKKYIQHHEDRRSATIKWCSEDREQDQSLIQSIDLLELLVPLCTIIIVHNTVSVLQYCVLL